LKKKKLQLAKGSKAQASNKRRGRKTFEGEEGGGLPVRKVV